MIFSLQWLTAFTKKVIWMILLATAKCEDKLRQKPNHAYALWYKAKAYYLQNEYAKSKLCFEKLDIIEPSWSESHTKPYLEKISSIESVFH